MNPERAPATPLDIFNVYFGTIYDPTMHLFFRLDGQIDCQRLKSAFFLLLDSDPYVSSRYTESGDMAYWERISRDKWDNSFSLHSIKESDPVPPEVPPVSVDVYTGPCAAVAVYRADGKGDIVTVSVHHGCCDARGLKDIASFLFSVYDELGDDPDYVPQYRGWYDRDTGKILESFSDEEIESETGRDGKITDRWAFPFEYRGRGSPLFALRTFPEERLALIKKLGKRYGATVNDVLIAANILALLKLRNDPSDLNEIRGVLTAADMRRHLHDNPEYSVENLSVAYMVEIIAGEVTSLEEAVQEVAAITREIKSGPFGVFDIKFYESFHNRGLGAVRDFFEEIHLGYDTSSLKNPVFSNIGILEEDRYDLKKGRGGSRLNIEYALFLPVICWPLGFLMSASTWKGSLSLQCGYEDGPYSCETVEKFLDCMDDLLP